MPGKSSALGKGSPSFAVTSHHFSATGSMTMIRGTGLGSVMTHAKRPSKMTFHFSTSLAVRQGRRIPIGRAFTFRLHQIEITCAVPEKVDAFARRNAAHYTQG